MAHHILGQSRTQTTLFPQAFDDFVTEDNPKGIKGACSQFVEMWRQMNMFTDSLFTNDVSKFKAVNNKSKNYTPKIVKFHIERVEKNIQQYLSQMDTLDNDEKADSNEVRASKFAWLKYAHRGCLCNYWVSQ
jgi:hypothetical protein